MYAWFQISQNQSIQNTVDKYKNFAMSPGTLIHEATTGREKKKKRKRKEKRIQSPKLVKKVEGISRRRRK